MITGGESLAGMVYCTLRPEPEEKKVDGPPAKQPLSFAGSSSPSLDGFSIRDMPYSLQTSGQGVNERSLAPHDIAILVRSNRQAEEYRQALTEAGIPAVVGSRQSVFQTKECREMFLLLQAIAAPGETSRFKTAMTICWFG